jgi:hypothetical protein
MTGKKGDGKKNLAAAGGLVRRGCLQEEIVTAAVAIPGGDFPFRFDLPVERGVESRGGLGNYDCGGTPSDSIVTRKVRANKACRARGKIAAITAGGR